MGGASVWDSISCNDLALAFFPCIYFSQQNTTFFDGTNINWKGNTVKERADAILSRSRSRQRFYEMALMMFTICDIRGIRLIVENPFSAVHYLNNNFPYKPAIIDRNRRLRGDYFAKPTQYWFVNCEPTYGLLTAQQPRVLRTVNGLSGHKGSFCDEDRSLISPDYARNFICDFILGKPSVGTELSLF